MTGPAASRGLEVVRAGALTTVQDGGRPGLAHLGVPRSGALDRGALAVANRLVGNPNGTAGLETTLTGLAIRASSACVVAVMGALATVAVDGDEVPMGRPVDLPAGAVLDIGPARAGVRSYLAVAGGVDVPPVLGSRSTDLLAGLGPAPLRDGDVLPIGAMPEVVGAAGPVGAVRAGSRALGGLVELAVSLGPRDDWFTGDALGALLGTTYRVSSVSNRIALRLEGQALERSVPRELPSEGVVLGAVQVPADGQPLIFLADHPTTGGYPVVAVVRDADLDLCSQARPGSSVRFRLAGEMPADRYGAQP